MKHLIFAMAVINLSGVTIEQAHSMAQSNPGISVCYTVNEPEALKGYYCLVYDKNK